MAEKSKREIRYESVIDDVRKATDKVDSCITELDGRSGTLHEDDGLLVELKIVRQTLVDTVSELERNLRDQIVDQAKVNGFEEAIALFAQNLR